MSAKTRTRRPEVGTCRRVRSTRDQHDNPVVAGRLRRHDCSQITDGGAAVILASAEYATEWAASHCIDLEAVPRILGWGHSTARMGFADKLRDEGPYVFPHVRSAILDAFDRAGIADVSELDAIECHDCFTTTHYMAIDQFGITAPGESWQAVEDGTVLATGRCRSTRVVASSAVATRSAPPGCGCCSTSRSR